MFGGPWDSTLIMMGVPSLKMGVPSFYISVEFWKVVHPSVKGFEQALAVFLSFFLFILPDPLSSIIGRCTLSNRCRKTSGHFCISPSQLDRNFRSFLGAGFSRRFGLI